MKTPTWGKVIGILMLFFGGCSVNSNIQSIYAPQFLEIPRQAIKEATDSLQSAVNNVKLDSLLADSLNIEAKDSILEDLPAMGDNEVFKNVGDVMDKMFYMSEFTKTWMVRFGYIGLFVSLIYILGGLFMLIRKPFSLKLALGALGISIIFYIIQMVVLSSDDSVSLMSMLANFSKIFGIIADIVLLVVILASDKTVYKNNDTLNDPIGQI